MVETNQSGFRERAHTADWALDVWAPDLLSLLGEAVRGMYALMGVALAAEPRVSREFQLPLSDPESLLVSFLSELLYLGERDGLGFDRFALTQDDSTFHCYLWGASIAAQTKEIKAVTYHQLQIRQENGYFSVTITFDV